MKNMDHYDAATLKLEKAFSLSNVLSACHQENDSVLNQADVHIMTSLVSDLIQEARAELSQIEIN